jgi:DNA-binding IclR family transcriptional regulator
VQGLGCIGAPIFEQEGSVTGAITISGAPHRVSGVRTEGLVEELLKTAAEISQYMGPLPAALET